MEAQINAMYHLNVSNMYCDDVMGVIVSGYSLEKLILWIIEQKEKLSFYKSKSTDNMNLLKKVISNYPKDEQAEVMRYMRSNGAYMPFETIERLRQEFIPSYI